MRYAFDFDTLYRHIGTICVHATWLEQELEDTVTELAGSDRVAAIVRGQWGSNSVNAIKRLLAENVVAPEETAKLRQLLDRAGKVLETRDKIVHTVWAKTNDTKPEHIKSTYTRASGSISQEWNFVGLEAVR
jgi:deoxyribodipyrimidine photolyase